VTGPARRVRRLSYAACGVIALMLGLFVLIRVSFALGPSQAAERDPHRLRE
jgi:uncharacterized membrane protein HdeD (DUF308 family)